MAKEKELKIPPSVMRHPLKDDIDKRLLIGDSILGIVKWLKSEGMPLSRPVITKYKEYLDTAKNVAIVNTSSVEALTIAKCEGAGLQSVNEMNILNKMIGSMETVDIDALPDDMKLNYGLKAMSMKQTILSDREDLKDKKRLEFLENVMLKFAEEGFNQFLIGIKDELRQEVERKKLDDEAIDAEYEVVE